MFFPEASFWSRDIIDSNTEQDPATGTEYKVSKSQSTKEKTEFMKVSADLAMDFMSKSR